MAPRPGRTAAAALLLALLAARPPAARAGDVVETYPDGATKETYAVDDQGRRQGMGRTFHPGGALRTRCNWADGERDGFFDEFFESGKTKLHALYRKGKLEGDWEERFEDGSTRLAAKYRDGVLDGPRILTEPGKPPWRQEWKRGVLRSVDGIDPHPRDLEAIRATLKELLGDALDPLPDATRVDPAEDRDRALRILKAYRWLAGVPAEDVVLDPALDDYVTAAAKVCSTLGRLTHEPPNPGMPAEEYRLAKKGAASSNLATTGRAADSVHMYMDDSDATNIGRVGHRRWCLNPRMKRTDFGMFGGYSAMWSVDAGRKTVPDWETVAWPPPGWVPVELFGPGRAWSLSPNPVHYGVPDGTTASVIPLDAEWFPAGPPLPLDFFRVSREGVGSGPAVIFRPARADFEAGTRWMVRVEGLQVRRGSKAPPVVQYVVEFTDLGR